MTDPVIALQATIVAVLGSDATLTGLLGADAIFDAPPKAKQTPYVTIARHDVLARDADMAPGFDHRLLFNVYDLAANRAAVAAIADRVTGVLRTADLNSGDLDVTLQRHVRTNTRIEAKSGYAVAAIQFQFLTEPAA